MTTEKGMVSLRSLYKIGKGPSSSHTMAPERAANLFKKSYPDVDSYRVYLYGSLAKTGRGHMTDKVIAVTLSPKRSQIIFCPDETDIPHPNTMVFEAIREDKPFGRWEVYSIGGGSIEIKGTEIADEPIVYPESTFDSISSVCRDENIRIWQYVERCEGPEIWDYLMEVWNAMCRSIDDGLVAEGELHGGLGVQRKARYLYRQHHMDESAKTREDRIICSYAFAVSEQNASAGTVVTAPTCGSAGVLPAVLRYQQERRGYSDREILHALATAGIIGNIIKTNASISGAECGCQAEIGSACSMASAGLAELFDMDINQIEYAAEVAMEHHLGLTCDPIRGLVQIPCIERNAVGACRAINAVTLANFLSTTRKISFDLVVQTMYETGLDLSRIYKETSEGGLAKLYI